MANKALIEDYDLSTVSLGLIEFGPRFRKDYSNIEALADSIAEYGVIQPISVVSRKAIANDPIYAELVAKMKEDGKAYLLLAGGRRLTALNYLATRAENPIQVDPPVKVYQAQMTEFEVRSIELAENIERENMTWQEEVSLKQEVHRLGQSIHGKRLPGVAEGGHSVADTAKVFGESRTTTLGDLHLARAMERMPELAAAKSKGDAKKILDKTKLQAKHEQAAEKHVAALQKETGTDDKLRKKIIQSYILRDCLEGMAQLPDASFHLVEIDPPFAIELHSSKKDAAIQMQDYNEVGSDDYIAFMTRVIAEAYRILRPGGYILLWFAPEPWFEQLYQLLQWAGKPDGTSKKKWQENEAAIRVKRQTGIWIKPNGQNKQPDANLTSAYESFFVASKGRGRLQKPGAINWFNEPPVPATKKVHPTEKPVQLMMRLYSIFAPPGAQVCIPFAGSGNGILAAYNSQMIAHGYDLPESGETFRNPYIAKVMEGEIGSLGMVGKPVAVVGNPHANRVLFGLNAETQAWEPYKEDKHDRPYTLDEVRQYGEAQRAGV